MLLVDDERIAVNIERSFAEIPEQTVLPPDAEDDAGVVSRTVRARFAALLYAEAEPSVASLLAAGAERWAVALDAFLSKSAAGLRRRKLVLRARMRR